MDVYQASVLLVCVLNNSPIDSTVQMAIEGSVGDKNDIISRASDGRICCKFTVLQNGTKYNEY